jgi:HAD superfamily hydrolase (TIGR01509 family)
VLEAVIFDVDGTLSETERDGHRIAFNRAFAECGLEHTWDVEKYGHLLAVTGGRRRIEGFLARHGHPDPGACAKEVHRVKTEYFLEWVRSDALSCRPGVDTLINELRRRAVKVGVATTGTRAWVMPLLETLFGLDAFEAIVTGDDVARLKPAPDAYHLAASRLGIRRSAILAVEDSPPGLAAARAAGLACAVVTSAYTREARFPDACAVLDSFDDLDVAHCESLLERAGL